MRRSQLLVVVLFQSFAWSLAHGQPAVPSDGPVNPRVEEAMKSVPSPPAPPRLVRTWREALVDIRTRSVDMQVALSDLERASASGRTALAGVLPSLNLQANVVNTVLRTIPNQQTGEVQETQIFPPNSFAFSSSLSLNIPLFAPRAWYAIGTASRQEALARLSLADTRRRLIASVAAAMVGVIMSERVAELNRITLRAALERLELTRRRNELGASNATALDVLRVDQEVAQGRAAVLTSDENLRQARESLGIALGYGEAVGVATSSGPEDIVRETERMCHVQHDLDTRPDVAVAYQRIMLARRAEVDVYYQFIPTINLVSNYQFLNQPFVARFLAPAPTPENPANVRAIAVDTRNTLHTWTIGAVFTWNIWDGGARYGALRDARAQAMAAEARAEAARRNAAIEVSRALRAVDVAEAARDLAQTTVRLAREADRLAQISFAAGRGTSLELVDTTRRLRESEVQLAQRELDAFQARMQAVLTSASCDD